MTASAHARLLIIGIWTEAWDDGVFEWKPLTLKARIFPVDAVNVADLLAELAGLGFVQQFDAGKPYGAIRNFQKYQRPKKPNSSGALPDSLREYVGSVPNQSGTDGENPPQMEDGGGREGGKGNEDTGKPASSSAGLPEIDLEEAERRCTEAAGSDRLGDFAPIREIILSGGIDLDEVLVAIRARPAAKGAVSSWKFYGKVLRDKIAERTTATPSFGPPKVFIARDSPEWDDRCRAAKHSPSLTTQHAETRAEGWYFPTPQPPSIEKAA
ncbi:hypothetical protein [Bosea sp. Root381]|uniref:hypothetical protein n=1 Tax=Bosea sp. Root381 TaxID=1736524 RepID=UPI0012E3BB13|nr:hypothetical protein [Bosea sp. Root381]